MYKMLVANKSGKRLLYYFRSNKASIKAEFEKKRRYRGVEQWLARWAHNPKAGGSNPSPAIFLAV